MSIQGIMESRSPITEKGRMVVQPLPSFQQTRKCSRLWLGLRLFGFVFVGAGVYVASARVAAMALFANRIYLNVFLTGPAIEFGEFSSSIFDGFLG